MTSPSQTSIWFFIGSLLLIYGVVATAFGFVQYDPTGKVVILTELHSDALWGILLLVLGAYSCARFYPKNSE